MISVVIPTIGEKILHKVIHKLQQGATKPNEIILVFPEENKNKASEYQNYKNTKIIISLIKGQVDQRILGFKNAKYEYVLQLDSDILVNKKTLSLLLEQYNGNKNICLSPKIINKDLIQSKNHNSYKRKYSGKITLWGSSIWYGKNNHPKNNTEVEWLQGGCVLHLNKNLITENYYPYKGKAYGEDVIHSCILRNIKKIRLMYCPTIKVIEIANNQNINNFNFKNIIEFIKNNYLSKKKIIEINNGNYFMFYIWFILFILKRVMVFSVSKIIK
jgi:GT2 family glycosyltransferase|tara:strand:- start:26452 stop:27270 length:819 start_codon:yes stop_codon:yes gene_type:complete